MGKSFRKIFVYVLPLILAALVTWIGGQELQLSELNQTDSSTTQLSPPAAAPAGQALAELPIKGRSPKTGYARTQFSDGWDLRPDGCNTRNFILARDLKDITFLDNTCKIASGVLDDPYSAKRVSFTRGETTSADVQIDHVVALSDAWQKGAQSLSYSERHALANDPLELLAVDGRTNQNKGDGDAATWLPPNKSFRCAYVARQIAVKKKYRLWVTRSEYEAINRVLATCSEQNLPED